MKATQGGEIGIVLSIENYIPYTLSQEDQAAAERLTDFFSGWLVVQLTLNLYSSPSLFFTTHKM